MNMGKEIERKYLVRSGEYLTLADPIYFHQGYLSTDPERVVRVRIEGDAAKITIKGSNVGITRDEFEYDIPLEDASYMLNNLALKPTICKYRYKIEYKGFIWEVDRFINENEGLVIAEVELDNEGVSPILPEWIGDEVSGDKRYYNSSLVKNPYSKWKGDK